MFPDTFKGDSRELQGYIKEIHMVSQVGFKDILRKFQVCLNKVLSMFQENFKKSFMGVTRMLQ